MLELAKQCSYNLTWHVSNIATIWGFLLYSQSLLAILSELGSLTNAHYSNSHNSGLLTKACYVRSLAIQSESEQDSQLTIQPQLSKHVSFLFVQPHFELIGFIQLIGYSLYLGLIRISYASYICTVCMYVHVRTYTEHIVHLYACMYVYTV